MNFTRSTSAPRLIIDSDPGTDDVLAILLALTTAEVLLLSVTFGNVNVRQCLTNMLAILFNLNNEITWRKQQGVRVGFDGYLKHSPPRVSVGANQALWDRGEVYDYYNGHDGLSDTTSQYPQFTAPESWLQLFNNGTQRPQNVTVPKSMSGDALFIPSTRPSYREILQILRDNEPNTITLVALGPLTNYAMAAAEDPDTFMRAKELVTMGGAVDEPGNVTPVAEFNIFSDPVAAERVYGLSSKLPNTTMPVFPPGVDTGITLPGYTNCSSPKQLKVDMMSLDITTFHLLTRGTFNTFAKPQSKKGSPLAQWLTTFLTVIFDKNEDPSMNATGLNASIVLNDPLATWYTLTKGVLPGWNASRNSPEDIRPEPVGQWTSGMTVADKRGMPRRNNTADGPDAPNDRGDWLGRDSGNRIYRILKSPGRNLAGPDIMRRLFGPPST